MAQKETELDVLQRQRNKGVKGWESWGRGTTPNVLLKLLVKDKSLYSGKVPTSTKEWQTRPPRRGKRHYSGWETDWQLKPWGERERLQQTSTNQHTRLEVETRGEKINNTAEKHQPAWKVGSWNPSGERIEIRVLQYKVQKTTAYAVTTPSVSTVLHSKPRCYAKMATLDTPTCSTCSERFPGSLSPKV